MVSRAKTCCISALKTNAWLGNAGAEFRNDDRNILPPESVLAANSCTPSCGKLPEHPAFREKTLPVEFFFSVEMQNNCGCPIYAFRMRIQLPEYNSVVCIKVSQLDWSRTMNIKLADPLMFIKLEFDEKPLLQVYFPNSPSMRGNFAMSPITFSSFLNSGGEVI